MRHHHEEGRGPRGHHGEHSERGEHGRRGGEHGEHGRRGGGGGGRRQRFFGHGELRLVILDILTRNASHGYELIKEIENLTQGNYSPSPGVIYPTLDLLQDQGLISVEEENGRKKIAITAEGSLLHAENQEQLGHIQERLQARMVGCELRKNPQMKRALENFKAVLDLKVNQQAISETQLKQIVAVIDRAAMEISQLD
ncbi:PadR family transcriptional regulator [Raoultella ornithinolytica]|jgi:DNA-binding PadR family transcriptional regulator|uniref:PadR family transcriptional regulator n=1 Tax=Raoultella ornithinolytica TaxID=54291 RepID=A0A1Y6GDM4_RAOOR|nr:MULTISPECIES: PadR family transcriptional regulator [Raoultella]HDX8329556.1 PadR family transcriptional regulator [Raoultella ornithinolytica CD1_MRS_4]AGJ89054.1 transcriptional regulator [Raoultella ornithinolytica B6]ALQ44732.1 Transcriptional regulator, PadR family [Raoultella ornithinolytica]AOO58891.1 PadR family transcriptional regulator [Raoultella ornithinolytica]APB07708.1 PadR family transcriptional regulator [Raoultella ornithinolytica]